ncbi:DNA metabolism protein [Lithospermum erythrorhizon]|uniref:DNA metabolism protein n=1 Tax=Lithospermum erythrorhizon TaxID=34254 RepID=A0AAV3PAU8_LITER
MTVVKKLRAITTVFVEYNKMLHGEKPDRGRRNEILTINFLKNYIHYAKLRIQADLTDEVLISYRDSSCARTLETIIRLSTAHAKLNPRRQVLISDMEAVLQVLNFAIYHQELNEMEE